MQILRYARLVTPRYSKRICCCETFNLSARYEIEGDRKGRCFLCLFFFRGETAIVYLCMTPAKKGVLRRCSLSQRAEMQKEKVQGRESSPMRNQETLRRKLNEAGATEQGRGSYFNAGFWKQSKGRLVQGKSNPIRRRQVRFLT